LSILAACDGSKPASGSIDPHGSGGDGGSAGGAAGSAGGAAGSAGGNAGNGGGPGNTTHGGAGGATEPDTSIPPGGVPATVVEFCEAYLRVVAQTEARCIGGTASYWHDGFFARIIDCKSLEARGAGSLCSP